MMRLRAVASYLPDRVLLWLQRRWPICRDPADGWNFWTDAGYFKYVRRDKRR